MTTPPGVAVHALIFAERVIRETVGGRHSLIGVFDTIDLSDIRQAATPWYVFASIIHLQEGRTKLGLSIARSGGGDEFEGRGEIEIAQGTPPPVKLDCVLPIHVFHPEPGDFEIQLRLDDKVMATRTLTVIKGDEKEEDGDNDAKSSSI